MLLHQTPEWFGEPPVYRNVSVKLIPRVDASGDVYVGFAEGDEIWKITGPEEYEVVVRGCVPEGALDVFRAEDEAPGRSGPGGLNLRSGERRSYQVMTDFAVLPDGRMLTRAGLFVDEGGRRSLELYSSGGGELLGSWSLGPGSILTAWAVMDGNDPTRHLDWAPYDGTTRLVQFPPIGDINLTRGRLPAVESRNP